MSHDIPFNDPRVVEVAEFVGDIWFEDGNVLGGRDLIAATGFKEASLPILDGDCMLHRQASFAGAFYTEAGAELGPDGDVNVFYLPTISDEFGTVVLGAGHSRGGLHRQARDPGRDGVHRHRRIRQLPDHGRASAGSCRPIASTTPRCTTRASNAV